jgi:hypothetical protein
MQPIAERVLFLFKDNDLLVRKCINMPVLLFFHVPGKSLKTTSNGGGFLLE